MKTESKDTRRDGETARSGSVLEVLSVMGRLGAIAFGGPVAHLAHFQRELIHKRRWVSEQDYADLIAFCQFLPGPASSQVGMGLGLMRAGLPGMFAAWFAFSLPSVVLLLLAASGAAYLADGGSGWIEGLMAAVVAIVADAVLKMARKLCPSTRHVALAIVCGVFMLCVPHVLSQLIVIAIGVLVGLALLPKPEVAVSEAQVPPLKRSVQVFGLVVIGGFVAMPVIGSLLMAAETGPLAVYSSFAQTGSLVFGGGHVVLPMLQAEVVVPGWMTDEQFLAGYGITQAMPGPIFTLSSYLGATVGLNAGLAAGGWVGYAVLALVGIYMPSFGLIALLLPWWHRLRRLVRVRQALSGVNAAVVGLLIAALYDPVLTKALAVDQPRLSVAMVLCSWCMLVPLKAPAWLVVVASGLMGFLISEWQYTNL